jgi:hypothetical protein
MIAISSSASPYAGASGFCAFCLLTLMEAWENLAKPGNNEERGFGDFFERQERLLVQPVIGIAYLKVVGIDMEHTVGEAGGVHIAAV